MVLFAVRRSFVDIGSERALVDAETASSSRAKKVALFSGTRSPVGIGWGDEPVDVDEVSSDGTKEAGLSVARMSSEETDADMALIDAETASAEETDKVALSSVKRLSAEAWNASLCDSVKTCPGAADAVTAFSVGDKNAGLVSANMSSAWAEPGKSAGRGDALLSLKEPGLSLRLGGVGEAVSSTTSTQGLSADLGACFLCRRGTASSEDANRMASSIGSRSRETR